MSVTNELHHESPRGAHVFVVDDDESFMRALRRRLEAEGFDVRTYPSGAALLDHLTADDEGCVLLDLKLAGESGLDVQALLHARRIPLPVIFLTGHGDVPTSVEAMRAGASNFLLKPVTGEVLIAAVTHALASDRKARAQRAARNDALLRLHSLTTRERQVIDLVTAGWRNRDVAARLNIAERTVKAHRAAAMDKLGVWSIAEATRLMLELEADRSDEAPDGRARP